MPPAVFIWRSCWGCVPAQVTVGQGHKSRDKVLVIEGLTEETMQERLQRVVPTS